jgi:hypothetical protein
MNIKWPQLSYPDAKDSYETVHLWTQIVGKIKLDKLPWINHSWHITLQVTTTGISSGAIQGETEDFQIDFNLLDHQLIITTSGGRIRKFQLEGLSVADFYRKIFDSLKELDIDVKINPIPSEMEVVIPFFEDHKHATYNPEHISAIHRAFLNTQHVLTQFRGKFRGKCSPVHLFWGSFDLAVSRFSGRKAPLHPGGVPHLPDRVAQEAYSHEVSSCGFWPGNEAMPFAAFYAYVYPEPDGYKDYDVKPEEAYYDTTFREYILPYEKVQQSDDPEKTLLTFLESTYNAAAELAKWDREGLEVDPDVR